MIYRALLMAQNKNIPKPLIHYDFSRYSNEDFLDNPDMLVKDITGNGYDLKLYNFAFAGMSGFGGYSENYNEYYNFGTSYNIVTPTSFEVVGSYMGIHYLIALQQPREIPSYKIKVSGVTEGHPLLYRYHIADGTPTILELYNGIHVLPKSYINETDTERVGFMGEGGFQIGVKVEQLPQYPGGLVSDGIDDYGECVKQFVLTDFTVVAVRNYADFTQAVNSTLVAKTTENNANGAFLFEDGHNMDCFSFGHRISNSDSPALFSYLTKTSFNGRDGTPGTIADIDSALLHLFSRGGLNIPKKQAVLYELRIYDHSLTQEELLLVKDDMMKNYEKNVKPLEGITYVADWDAKGRSNDEDADVRDKWIDKATGKVIDLHNFGYAGLSGWNGYAENFLNWELDNQIEVTSNSFTVPVSFGNHPVIYKTGGNSTSAMRIKVSGLTKGKIIYLYNDSELSFTIEQNGVYDLPESVSAPESTVKASRFQFIDNSPNVTVEQLPLYPGALVSDGVDDYGLTREAINEEVGTMLIHMKVLPSEGNNHMILLCGESSNLANLFARSYGISTTISIGYPLQSSIESDMPTLTRVPSIPGEGKSNLKISGQGAGYLPSKNALHRIILIREQLDDAAVEFLKWKVDKEYRDWCRDNGYEYAINQLTE